MFTAALPTTARTGKQPRHTSTDEWIRKLWYIYTMECYSSMKRNAFKSVLMSCVILEPIIQSEVSQKEKDKYCILTHIYVIYKDGMGNPLCSSKGDTNIKNRLLDSVGREGGTI